MHRKPSDSTKSRFIKEFPSQQNALDIFSNAWACKIPNQPGETTLKSGSVDVFHEDPRPDEAVDALGDENRRFDGLDILELGPLEAGHTYRLEKLGAKVLAIDSNSDAYLKCLIRKEILGLNSKFLLGDVIKYLSAKTKHFDVIFASGILYHLEDPIHALELFAQNCESLYIWTHVYNKDFLGNCPDLAPVEIEYRGVKAKIYRWTYEDTDAANFWGGNQSGSAWMDAESIVFWLKEFGFPEVRILSRDNQHMNGPSISLCARK